MSHTMKIIGQFNACNVRGTQYRVLCIEHSNRFLRRMFKARETYQLSSGESVITTADGRYKIAWPDRPNEFIERV